MGNRRKIWSGSWGDRKKFGEKSRFVSVRVPGSKVLEYREAIKKLVDDKFSRDSSELNKARENKEPYENEMVTFRDFREFGKDVGEGDVSKTIHKYSLIHPKLHQL